MACVSQVATTRIREHTPAGARPTDRIAAVTRRRELAHPPSASAPLLVIRDLAVSVPARDGGKRLAVASVSLTVHAGQTLAVVGESGSGKSLTALSVLNLVPPGCAIERGEIFFENESLLTMRERELRRIRGRRMAMIFQEPMSALNPVMTVGAQITESLRLHLKLNQRAAKERAARCLEEVGLSPGEAKLKAYPHELSGGMRQRVMIAMAISCEPSLLLADEPTTALDVTVQAQVLSLLRDLQRSRGLGMMLIAHDLGVVAQYADVVCVMYAGHVVELGPVCDVFARPLHPYTRALLTCRPSLRDRADRLRTVQDVMGDPGAMRIAAAGADVFQPWWPSRRVPGVLADFRGIESTLVEVRPHHWVGCWRTEAAIEAAARSPNAAPQNAGNAVVSISASAFE